MASRDAQKRWRRTLLEGGILSGFANNPIFAWDKQSYRAQLREDLIYVDTDETIYVVPNRFYTDFATIPRPLWFLISPFDSTYRLSATLHDYLYFLRGDEPYEFPRLDCDLCFLRAMRSEGASGIRATIVYRAVRIFGAVMVAASGKPFRK